MSNKIRTQNTIELILGILLLFIEGILYFFLIRLFYVEDIVFFANGYILLVVLYVIILTVFMNVYNGFRISFSKISDLIWSVSLSLLFTSIIVYIQNSLIANHLLNIFYSIIILLIQIIAGSLIIFLEWNYLYKKFPAKKTLLIYENEYESILKKLSKNGDRNFDIQEIISIDEGIENICKKLKDFEYILVLYIDSDYENRIVKECYSISKSIYVIPKIYQIVLNNAEKLHLIDTPLLSLNKFGPSQLEKIIKRIFDIVLSVIAVVFALPIGVIVACAIKLNDNGPIFYKQIRLTQYGRKFNIYKFRSMKIDAEKNGEVQLAKENDDRITSVGKVIRKLRLDEIPQLVNILSGDMSIVGPRPERPELAEKIYAELPEFEYRLKTKAGLTGYAQVYGKYNTTLKDKLLLDLMYIENYSLFLDIKIILMTVKTIFIKESTEGF